MTNQSVVEVSAGGLLESSEDGELRIAVIHRARYDDWSLPKGHPEDSETNEEAALREVEEETGCKARIIEIVQPTAYLVNNEPKIVVFYRMAMIERGEFKPDDEVSAVEWLTPADSVSRLTYETERGLVTRTYSL